MESVQVQKQAPCKYFNSVRGCKKGKECGFAHVLQQPGDASGLPRTQQSHYQSPKPSQAPPTQRVNVVPRERGSRVQGGGWTNGPVRRPKRPTTEEYPSLKVKRKPPPTNNHKIREGTPEKYASSAEEEDDEEEYDVAHAFKHLVVHCRESEYDVYIGRYYLLPPPKLNNGLFVAPLYSHAVVVLCFRRNPSIPSDGEWGNPFKIGKDGNRRQVIEKYEAWLKADPELCQKVRTELRGKVLGTAKTSLPQPQNA